jgi:hypothetical protein
MTADVIQQSYRRFLVDLHIADWDEGFLSKLDPASLAEAVASTGAKTMTVPANSHTGLNYWPSSVGREHRCVAGTDLFGRFVSAARANGLNPVAYYCTVYVDWYWEEHPDSRVVDAAGECRKVTMLSSGRPRRFSCCCPNNVDYRDFCQAQLSELASGYDVAAFNIDMTFWPTICYCATCQTRARDELGAPVPRRVDWSDQAWIAFVKRRQEWLVEFVDAMAEPVRARLPAAALLHQSQAYTQDWFLGASEAAAGRTDWLAADLYRSREELSFVFKLFNSLTASRPFEQISCWAYPDVFEHTTVRTESELEEVAYLPIVNDGAITFIEVIDPIGTHSVERYPVVRRVLDRIEPLEPFLGGELQQDVGIYVSFDASFDLELDGIDVAELGYAFEPDRPLPARGSHRLAAASAAATLMQRHIPFGVVTRNDLGRLERWQVLVLPNVALLDDEEVAAVRRYVENGGHLYASGATSLLGPSGTRYAFGLTDVFGVRWEGTSREIVTFSEPTEAGNLFFGDFDHRRPLAVHGRHEHVDLAADDATALATLTLPYTDPTESAYALIITDPPGIRTARPSIVTRAHGRGRVIYAAAPIEAEPHATQRDVFASLIFDLVREPPAFSADAPACVELTLFDRPDLCCLVLYALNVQADSPPIPVRGMKVRLPHRDRKFVSARLVAGEDHVPIERSEDDVTLALPDCDRLLAVRLDYVRHGG